MELPDLHHDTGQKKNDDRNCYDERLMDEDEMQIFLNTVGLSPLQT